MGLLANDAEFKFTFDTAKLDLFFLKIKTLSIRQVALVAKVLGAFLAKKSLTFATAGLATLHADRPETLRAVG